MTDEVDMAQHIAPKTDQLNSDDLIAGPRTIVITRVKETGNKEQPVNIFFEGDNGKPYKPCKSMRRVMTAVWGAKGSAYVGQSMTLWRDPAVLWAGKPVGGIRISHMTGIDKPFQMALTANDKGRVQYEVQPLRVQQQQRAAPTIEGARSAITGAANLVDLEKAWGSQRMAEFRGQLQDDYDRRKDVLAANTNTGGQPAQPGDEDYEGV